MVNRCVKGTMAIEGLKPSKQGENITSLFLTGRIDSKTAIEQIIKYHMGGEHSGRQKEKGRQGNQGQKER
jgi:hypothetical protein